MLLCLEVQPGTIFTEFALGCPGDPLQGRGAEDTHPLDSEGSLPLLMVVLPVACLGQACPQLSALPGTCSGEARLCAWGAAPWHLPAPVATVSPEL